VTAATPLRFVADSDALRQVGLADLTSPAAPRGVYATLEPQPPFDGFAAADRLRARSAGPVRPEPHHAWAARPVEVCRVADVAHLPGYGLLAFADGIAPRAPAGGLTNPDLFASAPGIGRLGETFTLAAPADVPELPQAGVFMPWGGRFNYGHFILDALPSLLALHEAGLAAHLPPIAPPLKRWQRELIARLGVDPVRELAAPVLRLGQAAYATSMDHFLHAPGPLLTRVRARLLRDGVAPPLRAERLYLSRRSHAHPMRILLNEVELERALAARGFAVVRPERFTPAEQIALARQAKVVVGPTGAGMANALFAEPGALVVDIQPQTVAGAWTPAAWVQAFGEVVGHDWWAYYAPAPAPMQDTPWIRRVRRGFRFGYRVPLDDFLPFLDARL
jgi:capsular polysaccharide biosynthesis protein